MADSADSDLVVMMAATSWDGIWMSERHLALQLAGTVPVLWVDPPVSWLTPLRNRSARAALRGPRLTSVAPGIWRLSPITVPGFTRPGLRSVARRQLGRAVRRAVRRLGVPVAATICASLEGELDVVPARITLLYGTDDWVAGAELMGLDRGWLERAERARVPQADRVVCVSEPLRQRWLHYRSDIVVVPNGCDLDRFARTDTAPLPADVRLPDPIAGFVGHLSERIDLSYLEAVADAGVSLLLVGPRQQTYQIARMHQLLARPNVQWVGPKPFSELPSYLRRITVGLTPYADSAFNRASFPLKTLEYLAAGRPVVSTDLPAAHELDARFVTVATRAEEFAEQTVKALQQENSVEHRAERRAYAAEHSWSRRSQEIIQLLDLEPARPVRNGS